MAKDFNYYFAQLRKTEDHRSKEAEKEIRKLYKDMLANAKHFVADEYYKLAEDGKLTYEILRANGRDARFLEEVEQQLTGVSREVSESIKRAAEDVYRLAYDGMIEATQKGVKGFSGLGRATDEMIKAAVNNPIATTALEKNYKDTVWDIKRQIATGLMTGDRYDTMAKRMAKSLDMDYKKAVRIVRTETGRVREAGHLQSAKNVNDSLKQGTTAMRLTKTWKTMRDERVRSSHQSMNNQTVAMDEDFILPDGTKTQAPKQSGVASQDINCRCYVSYKLMSDEEFYKKTGKHLGEISEAGKPYSLGTQPNDKLTQEEYTKFKKDLEKSSGKGFEDSEIKAMADSLVTYTEGDYTNILAAGGDFKGVFSQYSMILTPEAKAKAITDYQNIEKYLSYAKKYNGTVYRGLGFDVGGDYDDGSFDDLMKTLRSGKPVEMPSLTSWTTKKSYLGKIFDARTGLDDSADAMAEVTFVMENSKSGVSIRDYASLKEQEEVLFSKNTKYDVLDISEDEYMDDEDISHVQIVVKLKEHT